MKSIEIKPTLEEIKDKIDQDDIKTEEEDLFYELKTPSKGMPDNDDFIRAVMSFYNTLGGYVIIETGDLDKTIQWVQEHGWESTKKWKKYCKGKRIEDKINICDNVKNGDKNYVILSIDRAENPFEFVNLDNEIILRIGAHTKKINFNKADIVLLREMMEKRMISNQLKDAAKFWRSFYSICEILFSNPCLMDKTNKNSGENSDVKESKKKMINSEDVEKLKKLQELAEILNSPENIKVTLNSLITASEETKAKMRNSSSSYNMFQLIENYLQIVDRSRISSFNLGETTKWLQRIVESS